MQVFIFSQVNISTLACLQPHHKCILELTRTSGRVARYSHIKTRIPKLLAAGSDGSDVAGSGGVRDTGRGPGSGPRLADF